MCGIAGQYNFKGGGAVSPDLIEAMCDRIAYRGPDDAGVYTDGPLGLGHRRLSILDLSELGHQPMASPDGALWITFNGEIYNFRELRADLMARGCTFVSNCDTEVILHLYREYGQGCLEYLRGMFAFAIWDKRKSTLFMARDRIGKKPFFYYYNGKRLVFASEIKAILADDRVEKEINFEAFYDYFKYQYIPDPKTIYKNIFKLEPGHFMVCTKEGIRKKEYWDISFCGGEPDDSGAIAEKLLGLLDESVRLRMVSDVPLGAFLSGGIDSSAVVALMARQEDAPVTTCSIGFDAKSYDEVAFARGMAERLGTDHHEFTVKQNAAQILEKLAYWFDEPFADSSAVPTYYVSRLAKRKVTVALSGDGGDENFAGYEKYHLDHIENSLRRKIPGGIRSTLFPFFSRLLARGSGTCLRKGSTLLNSLSYGPDYGYYLTNSDFNGGLWDTLINDETRRAIGDYDPYSVTSHYYHKADTEDHLSKVLYTDLKTYLPGDILVKVDRMSMANSLEVRSPLLDHNVIAYAARIPAALKYRKGEKKYILKRSLRGTLPPEIMDRKKMGFSVPLADWLKGELKAVAEETLFARGSGLGNFFDTEGIRSVWEFHQTGRQNYATVLWSFLMFELWYRRFMA